MSISLADPRLWPPAPFHVTAGSITVGSFDVLGDVEPAWLRSVRCALGCLTLPREPAVPLTLRHASAVPDEGFELEIAEGGVTIVASSAAGAGYGAIALRQLLPAEAWRAAATGTHPLPLGRLADAPAYPWRGLMIDVSRHFMPKHDLLDLIDLAFAHRLNRLHLHLTDDQGWRVESAAFPQLHELTAVRAETFVGSKWRTEVLGGTPQYDGTPHGGYYSRADLAELTAYGADRGIQLVPEIDLPGHSTPLLVALPQLRVPELTADDIGPVRSTWGIHRNIVSPLPAALDVLAELIADVADAVASPYFHVGGDECVLDQWRDSPAVTAYLRQSGLADLRALRVKVNQFLTDSVAQLGRRPIVWDEAFVDGGLRSDAIVAVWRSAELGPHVARAGYDAIQMPEYPNYLNWAETLGDDEPVSIGGPVPLDAVAAWDPAEGFTDSERGHLLGLSAALWAEYIETYRDAQFSLFPRLSSLAATAWRGAPVSPWVAPAGAGSRTATAEFAAQLRRLDALGVEYRPLSGPAPWQQGGTGRRASLGEANRHAGNPPLEQIWRSDADPSA